MQGTQVRILVQEDSTCLRATTTEAYVPQLLKPACPRAWALQEKPPQWEAHAPQQSSPHSLQWKLVQSNEDPMQPKINK